MKKFLFILIIVLVSSLAEAKTWYRIIVYNGTQTGPTGQITNYTISSGDSLMVKAWKYYSLPFPHIDSSESVNWYLDSVYQFTAGGMVTFNQSGLISCGCYLSNAIQLTVAVGINDLTTATLPFPFSQSPNIKTNNLNYAITNIFGQVIERGDFMGEIILRTAKSQRPLPPGIYFVIYSDALDNRQVLTDKVFVSKQ